MRVLLFLISFVVLGFTFSAKAAPPDKNLDPNLPFDTEDPRGSPRTEAVFQIDPKQPMKDCTGANSGKVCTPYLTGGRFTQYPVQDVAVAPPNAAQKAVDSATAGKGQ